MEVYFILEGRRRVKAQGLVSHLLNVPICITKTIIMPIMYKVKAGVWKTKVNNGTEYTKYRTGISHRREVLVLVCMYVHLTPHPFRIELLMESKTNTFYRKSKKIKGISTHVLKQTK